MNITRKAQEYHKKAALVGLIPLFVVVITGALYRILRKVFEVEKSQVRWLLDVHVFSVAGFQKVYPVLLGLLIIFLTLTALPLNIKYFKNVKEDMDSNMLTVQLPRNSRSWHRILGMIAAPALLVTAITGILYTIEKYYGSADKKFLKTMMRWHQMAWLMEPVVWVSIVGIVGVLLIFTGWKLLQRYATQIFCPKPKKSSKTHYERQNLIPKQK